MAAFGNLTCVSGSITSPKIDRYQPQNHVSKIFPNRPCPIPPPRSIPPCLLTDFHITIQPLRAAVINYPNKTVPRRAP